MVILGRPQLIFFGFAIKKYINVLQQVSGSGRAPLARDASGNPF